MDAIAFDLGDTLIEYEGLPLSWTEHYPDALGRLAEFLGSSPTVAQIADAANILSRYNTRLYPRETELAFAQILADVCRCFSVSACADEDRAARAFFSTFRQRLRCFPDSFETVLLLKNRGMKIGIFTDVPYGMPRNLVLEDIQETGLIELADAIATSRDIGFRKPAVTTLTYLANLLGCKASNLAYVGNERKDMKVAKDFGCTAIL